METGKNESLRTDFLARVFTRWKRPSTLRMAPMIDVIFLLLIFFLVAAKWRPQEDFLPFRAGPGQTEAEKVGRPEPLIIKIWSTAAGCQVQIGQLNPVRMDNGNMEADLTVLMKKLRQCLAEQKRFASDPIEITCAPEVKWDQIAKLYNIFYGAGLTDITFTMTE